VPVVSRLRPVLLALTIAVFAGTGLAPSAAAQHEPRVPGELIVRLTPEATADVFQTSPAFAEVGARPLRNLVPLLNIWLVSYDEGMAGAANRSAMDVLAAVRAEPAIRQAQFNHVVEQRVGVDESRIPEVSNAALAWPRSAPNDPRFGEMWGLNNTGQTGGTPGADVRALDAWAINPGGIAATGEDVVVAIIDSGFDLNHPDVDWWKNVHESPTPNGQDNDGNGYVDDYNGWNAVNNNGTITVSEHGTHVSGTAAARGNNGIGVTGVNWNARVMPIRGSSGNEAIVVAAYGYVLTMRTIYNQTNGAQGAFVVSTNASFGVDGANPANFPIWCGMYDELGAVGIISAGATANRNWDIDVTGDVPTACPSDWLISVTNTTHNDTRNTGAGYGLTTIDLGAPGTNVLSTVPNNGYRVLTGTSMATPHVTGAVALLVSAMSENRLAQYKAAPADVALQVRQAILDGTDPIPGLITVTGGRLNLYNALMENLLYDGNNLFLTEDTVYEDEVIEGMTVFVPSGVTLTVENSLTLKADSAGNPSSIVVSGTIQGEADVDLLDGSTIVIRPGGVNLLFPPGMEGGGRAAHFDGTGALTAGPSASFPVDSADVAVAMWVRPEGTGTLAELATETAVSMRLSLVEAPSGGYRLRYTHDAAGGTQVAQTFTQRTLSEGGLYYVTMTRGGQPAAVRVFVDGERVGAPLLYTAEPILSPSATLTVGNTRGGDDGFTGAIDEFRLYADRLTQQEIRAGMHRTLAPADTPTTLRVYYRFDGESATAAADYSGYNHFASVTGSERAASPFPLGREAALLNGLPSTDGRVGPQGASLTAGATSTVNAQNQLALYATGIYADTVADEDLPEGVTRRTTTVWGAYERGSVTADLRIDFGSIVEGDLPPDAVLFRPSPLAPWENVTGEWVLIDETFLQEDATEFGEYALGYTFSVQTESGRAPLAASLGAAYPNPFRDRARLTLDLPQAASVTVEVLDVLGRRVVVLHEGSLPAGEHTLTLAGAPLAPGVYLVRASGDGFAATRRVTLIR